MYKVYVWSPDRRRGMGGWVGLQKLITFLGA
jgi:hypothetical protein